MKIITYLYFILLTNFVFAQQSSWELMIANDEILLADDFVSIGSELLEIKYQGSYSIVVIDSINSILKIGVNMEKEAAVIGAIGAIVTFGIVAVNLAESVNCGFLTNFCKILSIADDLDKVLKAGIGFIVIGGITNLLVNLSARSINDELILIGFSKNEKVAEINRFYAKHNTNKLQY